MKLLRLLKHRWLDERDAARIVDSVAMGRLQTRIAQSEQHHSGEIRLLIEAGLPLSYLRRGLQARDRAVTMFGKLRVWDTEHNNGVLIYLLLADHAIEIVADRGLSQCVPQGHWDEALASMREAFRAGHFEAGLMGAIERVDDALRAHFALAPGQLNPNELPDRPLRQ